MVAINFVLIFIYLYLLSSIPGKEEVPIFRLEDPKKKKKKKELSQKQELKTTGNKSKYIILFCFVEVTVLFC